MATRLRIDGCCILSYLPRYACIHPGVLDLLAAMGTRRCTGNRDLTSSRTIWPTTVRESAMSRRPTHWCSPLVATLSTLLAGEQCANIARSELPRGNGEGCYGGKGNGFIPPEPGSERLATSRQIGRFLLLACCGRRWNRGGKLLHAPKSRKSTRSTTEWDPHGPVVSGKDPAEMRSFLTSTRPHHPETR